nr:DNA-directed RNA polymerase subunit beta' [bacterium]
DQMAVHLPLSSMAQNEARNIMSSCKNLLKPADGEPIVAPGQDIVLGSYYLTLVIAGRPGEGKAYSSIDEAITAYSANYLDLHSMVKIKVNDQIMETTIGRIIFNSIVPSELGFKNETFVKGNLEKLISECFEKVGIEKTAIFVDQLKALGFFYATRSGITFCVDDIKVPEEKAELLKATEDKVNESLEQYYIGLITKQEHKRTLIESWLGCVNQLNDLIKSKMDPENPLHACIISKARGNISQYGQMTGLKGLVSSPSGDTIDLPVKSNFSEGLSELEYFISTHGSRKGKTDTALRTADAGYLTRRLVDVAQDIITTADDCGADHGIVYYRHEWEKDPAEFTKKLVGRYPVKNITSGKKALASTDQIITQDIADALVNDPKLAEIELRSTLYCQNVWGTCCKCYGMDLGQGDLVKNGVAVGIIAAQSIGEPGTQLSMRTFHTGGVASAADITQGLPRVEELFEARIPHNPAILADLGGKVSISEKNNELVVTVTSNKIPEEEYIFTKDSTMKVQNGEKVSDNQIICVLPDQTEIRAIYRGQIQINGNKISIKHPQKISKDFIIPVNYSLLVQEGDMIERGDALTEGHFNLSELLTYKNDLAVKKYLISEIQKTYMFVGSTIHDKHLEIIVRQMFSKVRITDPQDSEYLPREIVDLNELSKVNSKLAEQGQKIALHEPIVMGITKVSLKTESFLSAASFQETTSVLMNAAIKGKVDYLRGLKENTIIGKLIPVGTGFSPERYEKIIRDISH